jgi:DNA-binding CsgD family transcriptional regulator
VARLVEMAREGMTLEQIAQALGRTRQGVCRRLVAHGYDVCALRGIRCAVCGVLLSRAHAETLDGGHYCHQHWWTSASSRSRRNAYDRRRTAAFRRERPARATGSVTPEERAEIVSLRGRQSRRAVAAAFGLSPGTVDRIWRRAAPAAGAEEFRP